MPSRDEIVAAARGWIGTPYRHQAALKGVGCDCLGLLIGVWRELGGEADGVPPYTPDWAEAMGRETFAEGMREHLTEIDPGEAREGDLVLFRWRKHLPAKHAGILTAADRMVHAQERAAVTEVPVSDWWRRRMAYAFEFGRESPLPLPGRGLGEGSLEARRDPAPSPSPPNSGVPELGTNLPKSETSDFGWGGERAAAFILPPSLSLPRKGGGER